MSVKVGIIGGSGLSDPKIFNDKKEVVITTEFGDPSDDLICGKLSGVECVLLARHGRKHSISPSNVNYRANIMALKQLGCTHIIVSTACGSLVENIKPGDFVVLDQFIDRTAKREQTFYDGTKENFKGILHLPMDTPFCPKTREILIQSANEVGCKVHTNGTIVTIEGPRFASRAESKMHQSWGGHVVNMTTVPEVVLAKEMGLCYAAIACVTDYDCWKEDRESVSVEMVMNTLKARRRLISSNFNRKNSESALEVIKMAVQKIAAQDWKETLKEMKNSLEINLM